MTLISNFHPKSSFLIDYHPLKTATGAALYHFSSYFQFVQLHVQVMVQAKEQIETRNRIA